MEGQKPGRTETQTTSLCPFQEITGVIILQIVNERMWSRIRAEAFLAKSKEGILRADSRDYSSHPALMFPV